MTEIAAAVLERPGGRLTLQKVHLAEPRANEALVRLVASGICHSDLSAKAGAYGLPTPLILGHEGSGVVEAVGADVTRAVPGHHVVLSFGSCGACDQCIAGHPVYCRTGHDMNMTGCRADGSTAYKDDSGNPIYGHFVGQSSFASYALVRETSLVPVGKELPLSLLAPLGCGIQTGAGLVLKTLKPTPDDSLVVVGCGAVGLSALMAAVALGCRNVIAVDVNPARLVLADLLGATTTIRSGPTTGLRAEITAATGGLGANFIVDTTAIPSLVTELYSALDFRGALGLLGSYAADASLNVDARASMGGRRVEGSLVGDVDPLSFIPEMIAMFQAGRFPFDQLITRLGSLSDVNSAMHELRSGHVVKALLTMD